MDRFFVRAPNLGVLNSIRIRHDNTGTLPEWFLKRVEITETDTQKKYLFECDRWFATDREDGKIDRIIREAVSFAILILNLTFS